ncbi:hypothetical protein DERP_006706 [Dermatophagoides pteronyssinus]|uniref:Uncharacterized protein n=1 Tax=Dermatophagoides pteronyssinus TaxID=6956 RepID=A0ABQ8IS54_DERPT|nr:hypothetical protein DERP_006706 [Dermatophagoides pteronyssinus]
MNDHHNKLIIQLKSMIKSKLLQKHPCNYITIFSAHHTMSRMKFFYLLRIDSRLHQQSSKTEITVA